MTEKTAEKTLSENFIENIKETTHWIFAFAPITTATFLTVFGFRTDGHKLEISFIIGAILFNFVILGLRSLEEKDNELSLFFTFRTNRLKPPKESGELLFKTTVPIVEAKQASYFRQKMYQKFQTEVNDEVCRSEDEKSKLRLILPPIECEPLKISTADAEEIVNAEEIEREKINFKKDLQNDLDNSEAVIVVRKEELENEKWIFEAVGEWASKNSEVPVLVVRPEKRENFPVNVIADKFFWVRDNPKLIPWGLLRRAKDRATVWRKQASYNRAMVTNIAFLLLMGLWLFGVYVLTIKDKQIVLVKGIKDAMETKDQYEEKIIQGNDSGLNVSYWFRKDGKPHVFVTTERGNKWNFFENNNLTIIGCVFSNPSTISQWENGKIRSFDINGNEIVNICGIKKRPEEITSIVCSSFQPSGATGDDETVGICVFTGSGKQINAESSHKLLKEETESFHTNYIKYIKNGAVTALADRVSESGEVDY